MEKLYYILVRRVQHNGDTGEFKTDKEFSVISRSDKPYIGEPKYFNETEMLNEHPKLVVKHGGSNVRVAEVKYVKLEGRAHFVDESAKCPWAEEGKIDITK